MYLGKSGGCQKDYYADKDFAHVVGSGGGVVGDWECIESEDAVAGEA